jgi:hypothetical protein
MCSWPTTSFSRGRQNARQTTSLRPTRQRSVETPQSAGNTLPSATGRGVSAAVTQALRYAMGGGHLQLLVRLHTKQFLARRHSKQPLVRRYSKPFLVRRHSIALGTLPFASTGASVAEGETPRRGCTRQGVAGGLGRLYGTSACSGRLRLWDAWGAER